jgi:hypothetical protein
LGALARSTAAAKAFIIHCQSFPSVEIIARSNPAGHRFTTMEESNRGDVEIAKVRREGFGFRKRDWIVLMLFKLWLDAMTDNEVD